MIRPYGPIPKPEDVWCEVTTLVLWPLEVGDELKCNVGGVPGVATVTESTPDKSRVVARVSGLHRHANWSVSRDLFDSVVMSFHINRDGRASSSLNWKR